MLAFMRDADHKCGEASLLFPYEVLVGKEIMVVTIWLSLELQLLHFVPL